MAQAFERAREKASQLDPRQAGENCSFAYAGSSKQGVFTFDILGKPVRLSFPMFEGVSQEGERPIGEALLTIVLYHLTKSDGAPLSNQWISFSKLPGGLYSQAMRGYTSDRLRGHFLNQLPELKVSADAIGAKTLDLAGDLAVSFKVLPKVPIALVYWQGDEEFPEARADFLYDESASHHLPTDCYAILSSLITGSLIKGEGLF